MSSYLDFAATILSLLPRGAAWRPSEAEVADYGTSTSVICTTTSGGNLAILLTGGGPISAGPFFAGDTMTISNSVGNVIDGVYAVESYEEAGLTARVTIHGTFPANHFGPTTINKSRNTSDLMNLILGMGDNHQEIRDFLKELAYLREPLLTPYLSDLEKEYGLLNNAGLSETERREKLHGVVYAPPSTGTHEYMQDQLRNAGFDLVQVHPNNLASSPGNFFGGHGGEMITNNELYDRTILETVKEQALWPYVFVLGEEAVYDNSGKLVHVAPYIVSDALRLTFRELVMKYKPVHAWGIGVIHDDDRWFTWSENDTVGTSTTMGFANEDQTTGGFWYDAPGPYVLKDDATDALLLDDATSVYLLDG